MRTGDVSVPALTLRLLCTITQCPSEPTLPCTHKKTQWALGSSHHAVVHSDHSPRQSRDSVRSGVGGVHSSDHQRIGHNSNSAETHSRSYVWSGWSPQAHGRHLDTVNARISRADETSLGQMIVSGNCTAWRKSSSCSLWQRACSHSRRIPSSHTSLFTRSLTKKPHHALPVRCNDTGSHDATYGSVRGRPVKLCGVIERSSSLTSALTPSSSSISLARVSWLISAPVRVASFSSRYGSGYPSRRRIVWIASATTAQFSSRSFDN
jgi:hypothetical protein